MERCPLSLESAIEKLLGRKSSGSGLEAWEYGRRDPSRWPRGILYPQKLALTSLTSDGHSNSPFWAVVFVKNFRRICLLNNCITEQGRQPCIHLPTWMTESLYVPPPQKESGPGLRPVTGFPFPRPLRLAVLRWRYSNPPPPSGRRRYSSSNVRSWWLLFVVSFLCT
jgi:hypothetical protein